jgi:hypothetical protein
LIKAGLFGSAAALAGFLIYFGVMKLTGLEIGLISILVGFMVGSAVRAGSENRGGWLYQLLAIFLTYSAIGASYAGHHVPELIAALDKPAQDQPVAPEGGRRKGPTPAPVKGAPDGPGEASAKDVAEKPADEKADDSSRAPVVAEDAQPAVMPPRAGPGKPWGTEQKVIFLVLVVVVAYVSPILDGFSSPIGLLIVGFALWEAWKINKRLKLEFNGPFRVGVPKGPPLEGTLGHA